MELFPFDIRNREDERVAKGQELSYDLGAYRARFLVGCLTVRAGNEASTVDEQRFEVLEGSR
eukprot:2778505-Rhodomonas_salina.1